MSLSADLIQFEGEPLMHNPSGNYEATAARFDKGGLRRSIAVTVVLVLALGYALIGMGSVAYADPAPKKILVYGPTSGGLAEETADAVVTVWDAETWASKKTADFAKFDAIVFGDQPVCFASPDAWSAAIANRAVWSAAVSGNITINGTDPDFHGKSQFVQQSVTFAAAGKGTGLYVSLSCAYHHDDATPATVELLKAFGDFKAQTVGGCPSNAHIVASHPSLAGLDDSYMSNWDCSAHEGFTKWPPNFSPLVIIRDANTAPFTASDGTTGLVYVLAAGARTAGISVTPRSQDQVPGQAARFAARFADGDDRPVAGVPISFAVTAGPNRGKKGSCSPSSCSSTSAGQVSWSYVGGNGSGDDTVTVYRDENSNGTPDSGEPQTTALVDWNLKHGTYVSLGDSFSSGEGVPDFEPSSGVCHRSYASYARDLVRDKRGVPSTSPIYFACSGATTSALKREFHQAPQLSKVTKTTTLVTLSMGGNDVQFANVLLGCIATIPVPAVGVPGSCILAEPIVDAGLSKLGNIRASDGLASYYGQIRSQAAPGARVLVVGYPRFFPKTAYWGPGGCYGIDAGEQLWINAKLKQLNQVVRASAASAGVEYVDSGESFDGHELCNLFREKALNGLILQPDYHYSFHPNKYGQSLLADNVAAKLAKSAVSTAMVLPGETISSTHPIAAGSAHASFTTTWPGSDVTMTLIDPNGRRIDSSTTDPDVVHTKTATSETFDVLNPSAGSWTAELFGADVDFAGEPTNLQVFTTPLVPTPPTVTMVQSATKGGVGTKITLTAAANGGAGPFQYLWDFGDGSRGSGATVTHVFAAGAHTPSVIVTDAKGAQGFTQGKVVTISYAGEIRTVQRKVVLDTRTGVGASKRALGAGQSLQVAISGRGTVPNSGVAAAVVQLSASSPSASGYLDAYASGAAGPALHSLRLERKAPSSRLAIVPVGTGGRITLKNSSKGSAQVRVQLLGWVSGGTPVTPGATKIASGAKITTATVRAGATTNVTVLSRGGIPSVGVSSVWVQVSTGKAGRTGGLQVYPSSGSRPSQANVPLVKGRPADQLLLVKLGSGGRIAVTNTSRKSAKVTVRAVGWVRGGSIKQPGGIVAVQGVTVLNKSVARGSAVTVAVAGAHQIPSDARTVVLNVSAAKQSRGGYVSVYPPDTDVNGSRQLELSSNTTESTTVLTKLSWDGKVTVYNGAGSTTRLTATVTGWAR